MFVLHTDNGLEGLGDGLGRRTPADDAWVERMVGTDPWDWIAHPDLPTRLAPAVYDVVAKYNDVPVYKLFGQRFTGRPVPNSGWMTRRVPVSAWTVSQTPSKMAEEVEFAAATGHRWLKYHTNHFHNVVAQTEAMQEVAPPGFKVHYDMNFDGTVEQIVDVSRKLENYPWPGRSRTRWPTRTSRATSSFVCARESPSTSTTCPCRAAKPSLDSPMPT